LRELADEASIGNMEMTIRRCLLLALMLLTKRASGQTLLPVDGLYFEAKSPKPLVVVSFGAGKWLLAAKQLLPLSPSKNGGWTVRFPNATGVFSISERPDNGWRLSEDGSKRYSQRRDPLGARLGQGLAERRFTRVDQRRLIEQATLERCVAILRDPDPERLRKKELSNIDPKFVAARGGVVGLTADELQVLLAELRPLDPARIERDQDVLAKIRAHQGTLWTRDEDHHLSDLIVRRRQSKDTIEIRHSLAVIHDQDKSGSCQLALLTPDPHDPLPPLSRSGTVRRFFALETGSSSCDFFLDARQAKIGSLAGLNIFLDGTGAILGLQIVGYMFSEVYLAEGHSPDEAIEMFKVSTKEIERQAE
jgi:hypothetical protein